MKNRNEYFRQISLFYFEIGKNLKLFATQARKKICDMYEKMLYQNVRGKNRLLTETGLMNRVSTCDLLLQRHESDPFLKRLVTGDETWILYQNVHRKRTWSKENRLSTEQTYTDFAGSAGFRIGRSGGLMSGVMNRVLEEASGKWLISITTRDVARVSSCSEDGCSRVSNIRSNGVVKILLAENIATTINRTNYSNEKLPSRKQPE
ncbi:hypothetical protein WN51_08680 [Melipona quadrifasciata]|uniref:Histone-lysine N-methyltransferase SETMAR n=1 Tax=Melipona quadrifasciata TaxID=166423 RepID=A0A0N0U763_9HYME|nr:hypothetical protein WN51_08680 [Melipona quadrifasciata]